MIIIIIYIVQHVLYFRYGFNFSLFSKKKLNKTSKSNLFKKIKALGLRE
jgi:hypothetical protein